MSGILAIIFLIITIQGFQKSEYLESEIIEDVKQVDIAAINLLNACDDAQTEDDFLRCEDGKSSIIESCKQHPEMSVCNDPRLR